MPPDFVSTEPEQKLLPEKKKTEIIPMGKLMLGRSTKDISWVQKLSSVQMERLQKLIQGSLSKEDVAAFVLDSGLGSQDTMAKAFYAAQIIHRRTKIARALCCREQQISEAELGEASVHVPPKNVADEGQRPLFDASISSVSSLSLTRLTIRERSTLTNERVLQYLEDISRATLGYCDRALVQFELRRWNISIACFEQWRSHESQIRTDVRKGRGTEIFTPSIQLSSPIKANGSKDDTDPWQGETFGDEQKGLPN